MLKGEQGSGPEGVDDLYCHTYGELSPSSPSTSASPPSPGSEALSLAMKLKFQHRGTNANLAAQIIALKLNLQPGASNFRLEALIPALRLASHTQGFYPTGTVKEFFLLYLNNTFGHHLRWWLKGLHHTL